MPLMDAGAGLPAGAAGAAPGAPLPAAPGSACPGAGPLGEASGAVAARSVRLIMRSWGGADSAGRGAKAAGAAVLPSGAGGAAGWAGAGAAVPGAVVTGVGSTSGDAARRASRLALTRSRTLWAHVPSVA